jgi:phosphomethylpyrimidine synthase
MSWSLVTDIAMGYDHIAAAIGALLRALRALISVLRDSAEHIRLPNIKDVKEGLIASEWHPCGGYRKRCPGSDRT